jgi:hypothetical protein
VSFFVWGNGCIGLREIGVVNEGGWFVWRNV